MLVSILSTLNIYYNKFMLFGFAPIHSEFKSLCCHLGKEIEVVKGHQVFRGINTDIDNMGNLIITNANGHASISTGDVRVVS